VSRLDEIHTPATNTLLRDVMKALDRFEEAASLSCTRAKLNVIVENVEVASFEVLSASAAQQFLASTSEPDSGRYRIEQIRLVIEADLGRQVVDGVPVGELGDLVVTVRPTESGGVFFGARWATTTHRYLCETFVRATTLARGVLNDRRLVLHLHDDLVRQYRVREQEHTPSA
jgi:hypothetical protein